MVKRLASKLLRLPIIDSEGQKIGRLNDVIVETRTGSMVYLVIEKVDSKASSEIIQQLPSGEMVIPVSVAKFDDDSVVVDSRKLRLLSLKKSLKMRTFLAKNTEPDQSEQGTS